MPLELTNAHPPVHRLAIGEVVMVHKELTDKKTQKPFTWKFFAVVTQVGAKYHRAFQCMVLDEKQREPITIFHDHAGTTVWYLTDDEWPDGVYAFRTRMILEGRLDMAI